MKKFIIFLILLLPTLAFGQFKSPGQVIGIDTTLSGADAPQHWIYPPFIRVGANMALMVNNDTLIISGDAGVGTQDIVLIYNRPATTTISSLDNTIKLRWGNGIYTEIAGDSAIASIYAPEINMAALGGQFVIATHLPDLNPSTIEDNDILTYNSDSTKFEWQTPIELGLIPYASLDTVRDEIRDTVGVSEAGDVDTTGTKIADALSNRISYADTSALIPTKGWTGGSYQPLEATLTDIADGTIAENLVNTVNPWADDEVANNITVDEASDVDTTGTKIADALGNRISYSDTVALIPTKGWTNGTFLPLTGEASDVDTTGAKIAGALGNRLSLSGGTMTGNIVMSGSETVDGKDVSTLTDIGQTVESGEITNQTIVKADIDTTSDFTFNRAHKYNGNVADSEFTTENRINYLIEDSLDEYALLDNPTFTTGITVPNNSISDEELDEGATFLWTGSHSFNQDGSGEFHLPSMTAPATETKGELAWDTDNSAFEIYDSVAAASRLIPSLDDKDGLFPDPENFAGISPVAFYHFDSDRYPNGVKITNIQFRINAAQSYVLDFDEHDNTQSASKVSDVDTLNGTLAYEERASGDMDDPDIAADNWLYVTFPDTDIDWVYIKVIFWIK